MKWLTPLCQNIVADRRFSRDQRDTAVLWAGEMSALCDKWVPNAPMPNIDADSSSDHEGRVLILCWLWQNQRRSLSIYIETDMRVSLRLLDREFSMTEKPSHEVLKRSVQAFFEGWEPTYAAS